MLVVQRQRFEIVSGRSAVLLEARSNVGPIEFGTTQVGGEVTIATRDGASDLDAASAQARLEIEVGSFASGNPLHDAELRRWVQARRYPTVVLELGSAVQTDRRDRYHLQGTLTFHGITREVEGSVGVRVADGLLHVDGEHVFDVRDYDVSTPNMLMMRIYPEVRVGMVLQAGPSA